MSDLTNKINATLGQFDPNNNWANQSNSNSALDYINSSLDPLSGPVATSSGYQFGDILGGGSAAKAQAAAQANMDYAEWVRNEASAKAQRQWEEYMSNTQVQRTMADLKAAGINPWLAVQSAGFGQSTPVGQAASSSAGQAAAGGGAGKGLTSLGTAAFGIAMLIKTVAKFIK